MAKLHAVADTVTRRLPKVVSSRGHAIADYVTAGIFVAAGALFWKRNKRAAAASLLCGSAGLVLNLMTDYPGGIARVVSFPKHGRIDIGLAALTATMPELLGFHHGRSFFLLQSGAITATTNLTRFNPVRNYSSRKPPRFA
jgi:hypothetical protein